MANEAHVRIDEGIARGPRKPPEARRRSPKADLGTWVIPADLNPHEVLERFLSESTTSHIAAQYGLSRKALVKWLRATVPLEWKEAQLLRAHCKLEDGEDGLDTANDAISLARAREQAKAAQFRLTALDRDYHPKQELTVTHAVPLEVSREIELLREELGQLVAPKTHDAAQQLPIIDVVPEQQIIEK